MKLPDPSQWSEIEELFFEALQQAPESRAQWLERATGEGREELAREVATLIEAHEASEAAAPQRRIGAYLLERRIGLGGMGEVWLASRADGQFEQRVAIKLVRAGLGSETLLRRFQQERRLLARLSHPGIARLLDGGVSPQGRPYLVMEYVEGEPILDFCSHHAPDLRGRIGLILQLCGAVDYAHRNLIVHRDIKPANVLVSSDGSAKLLDFGIAKLMEDDAAATMTGLGMLTPRYASPEQLRGEPVTTASDLYSLAVLAYELATGSLPYGTRGGTPAEIISAIATESAVPASRASTLVPRGDLDAVLAKALEKDAAARYSSVEQFAADLRNYLNGLPVIARAPTVGYRLGKYLRRHWAGAAAVAVVVVALAVSAVVSLRAARLALLQQARSARVTQFLEDMLGSVDPGWEGASATTGADTRVLDLLPAARRRIPVVFADDPAAQARLHRIIARAYTSLQQFPDAEAESKAALALLPALAGDPAESAKVLFVAGNLDYLLSHRREEETELREALSIFESTPGLASDPLEHAVYVTTLAEALSDVGKREEAERYADAGSRLLAGIHSPATVRTGIIHDNLAIVYQKVGKLEAGRTEARIAVAQLALSPRPLAELSQMYLWLSIIDRYLGDLADAKVAADRGVDAAVRAAGADAALTIAPRIEKAYLQAVSGNAAQAVPELRLCLSQARAARGPEDLFHALHSLGYVLSLAGRAGEGEPLLREALQVGATILSPTGPSIGMCSLEMGECLERQGRTQEARGFYRTARDNFRTHYGSVSITLQAQQRLDAATARPAE